MKKYVALLAAHARSVCSPRSLLPTKQTGRKSPVSGSARVRALLPRVMDWSTGAHRRRYLRWLTLVATIIEMDERDRFVVFMDVLNRPVKLKLSARQVVFGMNRRCADVGYRVFLVAASPKLGCDPR